MPDNAQGQGDIVERRQVRHQPEILKHRADPAAKCGRRARGRVITSCPNMRIIPRDGPLRQIQQLSSDGLARAAGSGEEIEAARIERERNIAQHLAFGAIAQADIVELDDAPASLMLRLPRARSERRKRQVIMLVAYSGVRCGKKPPAAATNVLHSLLRLAGTARVVQQHDHPVPCLRDAICGARYRDRRGRPHSALRQVPPQLVSGWRRNCRRGSRACRRAGTAALPRRLRLPTRCAESPKPEPPSFTGSATAG